MNLGIVLVLLGVATNCFGESQNQLSDGSLELQYSKFMSSMFTNFSQALAAASNHTDDREVILISEATRSYLEGNWFVKQIYTNGPVIHETPSMIFIGCFCVDEVKDSYCTKFDYWIRNNEIDLNIEGLSESFFRDMAVIGVDVRDFYKQLEWNLFVVPRGMLEEFNRHPNCEQTFTAMLSSMTMMRKVFETTSFYVQFINFAIIATFVLFVLSFYEPKSKT